MTDKEILESLKLITDPSESEMNIIFIMYKKFIRDIPVYTTGCSCENNITKLYKDLMEWYKNNPINE